MAWFSHYEWGRTFENATAGTVLMTAPAGMAAPAYVRYAWRNDPRNTLANTANLPAAPFRTDS